MAGLGDLLDLDAPHAQPEREFGPADSEQVYPGCRNADLRRRWQYALAKQDGTNNLVLIAPSPSVLYVGILHVA